MFPGECLDHRHQGCQVLRGPELGIDGGQWDVDGGPAGPEERRRVADREAD